MRAVAEPLTGLANSYLAVPLAAFGAIVGAAIGGMLFPHGPRALELSDQFGGHSACGNVLQSWLCRIDKHIAITVLMENALYSACSEELEPAAVLGRLERGEDPEVPASTMIPIREFKAIEFTKRDDREIMLCYGRDDRLRRRHKVFGSMDDRRQFFVAIQKVLGQRLVCSREEVDLWRAVRLPGAIFLVVSLLAGSVAWLAAHWRAFPPPPPVGKVDPDPLVSFLTWAGPTNVLLAALPLAIAVWAWMVSRAVWSARLPVDSRRRCESREHG